MKSKLLLFTLLLLTNSAFSQKLIWTSENGGENQNGAISGYDLGTNQLSTIASLAGNPMESLNILLDPNLNLTIAGNFLAGGLTTGSDGDFYGINEYTNFDGTNVGSIYKIYAGTYQVELLHTFTGNSNRNYSFYDGNYSSYSSDLRSPNLELIEAEPGVFYGIATKGGLYNEGGIWKYDTNTSNYSKVDDFDTLANGVGREPSSPLIIGLNGDLFGVLKEKGTVATPDENGHLYKVDLTTQKLSYVISLNVAGWAIEGPSDAIVYNTGVNKIFGTKEEFTGGNWGGGIWSYSFNNNTVTNEAFIPLSSITTLGSNADGMTPIANDGNHYFITRNSGAHSKGTLVKYAPGGNQMAKVHDFVLNQSNSTGFIIDGDKIYGTYNSSNAGEPMVWSFDTFTNQFKDDYLLGTDDNTLGYLISHDITISNGELYGRTYLGGTSDAGSLFRYNLNSEQTNIIQNNASTTGRGLIGEITLVNNSLAYSYTAGGGDNGNTGTNHYSEQGGIVKINLSQGTVQIDNSFDLSFPSNSNETNSNWLKIAKTNNGNLYSLIRNSSSSNGSGLRISKFDSANNQLNHNMYNFEPDDYLMSSALEYAPNKLAIAYLETIYLYDDVSDIMTEVDPNNDAVANGYMSNNLTLSSNGKIYGTTKSSDFRTNTGNNCVIYSLDPSTWQMTVEHTFDSAVKEVNIGLTESNGKLWGNTHNTGTNDDGILFSFDISNSTFTIEHNFDSPTDGGGFNGQWTEHNNKLYAVSYTNGGNGYGTLAEFDISLGSLIVLADLTLENGRASYATPTLWDDASLSIDESQVGDNNNIKVYPNPTSDKLIIEMENVDSIKIYNIAGQLLRSQNNSKIINTKNLGNGVYIIKIWSNNKVYTEKFIKK